MTRTAEEVWLNHLERRKRSDLEGDLATNYALLSWSAQAANGARTCDGADTFVVRDGRIVAQTIHYGVTPQGDADAR